VSTLTVAKKDLTSVRRSRLLWAAVVVLTLGASFFAFSSEGHMQTPAATVRQLFGQVALVMSVLLPIVALMLSYLAIAGERRSGGIKFLLGVPNTRRDVFLGKLGSRLLVVAGALGFVFVGIVSAAVAGHGALPLATVSGLFFVSLLYASVFVCIAVALSAGIATRSRAIGVAVGSYFVLVILFVVPGIRITAIVAWIQETLLGLAPNRNLYDMVTYLSPYIAFRKATNLVFPADMERTIFYRDPDTAAELPVYLSDEFAVVLLAAWLLVPLVLGYLRFERADLE